MNEHLGGARVSCIYKSQMKFKDVEHFLILVYMDFLDIHTLVGIQSLFQALLCYEEKDMSSRTIF